MASVIINLPSSTTATTSPHDRHYCSSPELSLHSLQPRVLLSVKEKSQLQQQQPQDVQVQLQQNSCASLPSTTFNTPNDSQNLEASRDCSNLLKQTSDYCISLSDEDLEGTSTCCAAKGTAYCCMDFERRILSWVEKNVPRMVNPESKKDEFFTAKRSILLLQRTNSIKLVASSEIEDNDNHDDDEEEEEEEEEEENDDKTSSSSSSKSSMSSSTSLNLFQLSSPKQTEQQEVAQLPSISLGKTNSAKAPHSLSSFEPLMQSENPNKFMTSSLLLRRRQSQAQNPVQEISKTPALSGSTNSKKYRLSVFTSNQISSPQSSIISEENHS